MSGGIEVLHGWIVRGSVEGFPVQAVHLNAHETAAHLEQLADPNATVHAVRIEVLPDVPHQRDLPST